MAIQRVSGLAWSLGLGALLLLPSCSSGGAELGAAEAPPQGPPAAVAVPPQSAAVRQVESEVLRRINDLREKHGLRRLEADDQLAEVAREHSRLMAKKDFFSHTSPSGESLVDRFRKAGIRFRIIAENIARNWNLPDPAAEAVQGWMKSQGHRANILHPDVTRTGVGIWKDGKTWLFTQVFLQ